MEKWNSKKANELGIDENLLKAVNVAVKAGRHELDALVNDVAKEEQYKVACIEIDAKRKECLESDLKVYGSPRVYNPVFQLPFIGWRHYNPDILGVGFGSSVFGDIEPIFVCHEIDTAISGDDKLNLILRSLGGFIVNGAVRWFVNTEEEVYYRIAKMNSIIFSSIKEFDVKTNNHYQLLDHVEGLMKQRFETVSAKELCNPAGIKMWLSEHGYNSKEVRQDHIFGPNDDNTYGGGYSEKERELFIHRYLPYPQLPVELGGDVVNRHRLAENFIFALYPEKSNDLTLRRVVKTLLSK